MMFMWISRGNGRHWFLGILLHKGTLSYGSYNWNVLNGHVAIGIQKDFNFEERVIASCFPDKWR